MYRVTIAYWKDGTITVAPPFETEKIMNWKRDKKGNVFTHHYFNHLDKREGATAFYKEVLKDIEVQKKRGEVLK